MTTGITKLLDPAAAVEALCFVRARIESELELVPVPELPVGEGFERLSGAFVSLHKAGHLRGCMGIMEADMPLAQTLARTALNAAFDDPRFPPLKPDEWTQCEVELSILSPLKECLDVDHIVVGRDGVLVRLNGCQAVFLPQVALELGWSREEMLSELCMKAGLPADGWKDPACRFYTFQAQIIRDGSV